MGKEAKIILGIGLAVVLGGVLLFTAQPTPEAPGQSVDPQSLVRETSHMTGKKDAKVSVVEFADYECPACALASPTLSRLREEYKNNPEVNFVYRHFPLPQHKKAIVTAEAAEAAAEQGKFWEMTDRLYTAQKQWQSGDHAAVFLLIATELGLDVAKFKERLSAHVYSEIINTDKTDGQNIGVNSTPSIFINGEKTNGFNYDDLKNKIEEELK